MFDPTLNPRQLALQIQRELIESYDIDSELFMAAGAPVLTFEWRGLKRQIALTLSAAGAPETAVITAAQTKVARSNRVVVDSVEKLHAYFHRPGLRQPAADVR